jgi:hypothetical protein
MNEELKLLLLYDEMLIFSKELEDAHKMAIFAEMENDFHNRQLMQEINAEDESTTTGERPSN